MNEIKFSGSDKGLWRRLCWTGYGRINGKQRTELLYGLDTLVEKLPEQQRFTVYVSQEFYRQIKKWPIAYMRGRWLYLNYRDRIFFVKKVSDK